MLTVCVCVCVCAVLNTPPDSMILLLVMMLLYGLMVGCVLDRFVFS